jgi:SPP1 family predicted phage head-tail adaptor
MANCNNNFATEAKHQIKIQQPIETADGSGGFVAVWEDITTCFAKVETASVYESVQSKANQSEVTHKITIRYRSEFANTAEIAKYRIILDGRIHSIQGVNNLDLDQKSYGKFFNKFSTRDNGAEYVA